MKPKGRRHARIRWWWRCAVIRNARRELCVVVIAVVIEESFLMDRMPLINPYVRSREPRCAAAEMDEVGVRPSPPIENGRVTQSQELSYNYLCILSNAPRSFT